MTREEIQQEIEAITFDRFPIPIKLWMEQLPSHSLIIVEIEVRNRDTGEFGKVRFPTRIPVPFDYIHVHQLHEDVRRAIHGAIRHEIDECLMVHGKRKWDPHAI